MRLTMLLPPILDEAKWTLAAQMGITEVITKAAPELTSMGPPSDPVVFRTVVEGFKDSGFRVIGLEGDQFDMSRIKLGLQGRDEDIDKFIQLLVNMEEQGIPMICWNFMATIGWYRTRVDLLERGGALTSEFDIRDTSANLLPPEQSVAEVQLRSNIRYFLDAVLPEAEKRGISMALHPDDPPISPIRGVGRIITSAAAYDELFGEYSSPAFTAAFCQATFLAMGEDISNVSKRWLEKGRLSFIHLRDIDGEKERFRETFHDNGPTPMAEMLNHYHSLGFTGPIRPDHAPVMYGERQGQFSGGISAGYEMIGKVFAVGYIRGICEASNIPLD